MGEPVPTGTVLDEGIEPLFARSDHIHTVAEDTVPTGDPIPVGTSLLEGTATVYSRADHQHTLGPGAGDTEYLRRDGGNSILGNLRPDAFGNNLYDLGGNTTQMRIVWTGTLRDGDGNGTDIVSSSCQFVPRGTEPTASSPQYWRLYGFPAVGASRLKAVVGINPTSRNYFVGMERLSTLDRFYTKVTSVDTVSTPYAVLDEEYYIAATATGTTDMVIDLPSLSLGDRVLIIQKADATSGKVTVNADGTDTINGDASVDILFQYDAMTLHGDSAAGVWRLG
jgi:hypothetical protein